LLVYSFQYSSDEITENMLCAFSSGKDACQGDRGGFREKQIYKIETF